MRDESKVRRSEIWSGNFLDGEMSAALRASIAKHAASRSVAGWGFDFEDTPSILSVLRVSNLIVRESLTGIITAQSLIPEVISFSFASGVDPKVALVASVVLCLVMSVLGGRPAMVTAAAGRHHRYSIHGPLHSGSREHGATVTFTGLDQRSSPFHQRLTGLARELQRCRTKGSIDGHHAVDIDHYQGAHAGLGRAVPAGAPLYARRRTGVEAKPTTGIAGVIAQKRGPGKPEPLAAWLLQNRRGYQGLACVGGALPGSPLNGSRVCFASRVWSSQIFCDSATEVS
jgi:hypothetical protein